MNIQITKTKNTVEISVPKELLIQVYNQMSDEKIVKPEFFINDVIERLQENDSESGRTPLQQMFEDQLQHIMDFGDGSFI